MTNLTICDALVVGAGLGGIYQAIELRRLGLETICIDKAPEVGGTWYWNRYPGAMSDTESYLYRYSWDKEDLRTYPWNTRYLYQPEILKYLNHVVDKNGLRPHIQLNTTMDSATWIDRDQRWRIDCGSRGIYSSRYLINALGLLSEPNYPKIPGLNTFQGHLIHTSRWQDVEWTNKRVGVIGSGSTGVQLMICLAPKVQRLVSFQRTPQYSVPSGQGPISAEERQIVNENYDKIYSDVWASANGHGVPEVSLLAMSVSADERRRIFQENWDQGNAFRFLLSGFGDLTTSVEANWEACKFIHSKIDEIVKDPRKAEALKPTDLHARRPLCDSGYYQIFNRENVDVVDLRKNPISQIVPEGIQLNDRTTIELDALILATGFDAIDGSYRCVSIEGQGGKTLADHWKEGCSAYLGVACSGFPNMFLVSGPQGPFANFPTAIESEVNFITRCVAHAERQASSVTVSSAAEQAWLELCDELTQGSIYRITKSWIFGENVEGRSARVKFYFGGLAKYLAKTKKEIDSGFPSFLVDEADGSRGVGEVERESVWTRAKIAGEMIKV